MLGLETANFVDARQNNWKVIRQKTPLTPVINQEVEVDKKRDKPNRIKKVHPVKNFKLHPWVGTGFITHVHDCFCKTQCLESLTH